MSNPMFKLTVGSIVFERTEGLSISVTRVENGVDTATIILNDYQSKNYPSIVTVGTSVLVEVKDSSEASYTTIFNGIVRFAIPYFSKEGDLIKLKCDGTGYGFLDTVCAQEYGATSRNATLDTIAEILTDGTNGVVPNWVNKILGGTDNSGFGYTTTNVDTITGTIPYMLFPYKPNNKILDDLCDLVTAIKAGNAGCHWIVDTNSDLHVKLINGTQTTWTKYYGDSQANATLEQGIDFQENNFEKLSPEANLVLYYGVLRKPAGEVWTENGSSFWSGTDVTITDETTHKLIGDYSISIRDDVPLSHNFVSAWTPVAENAGWDFTKIGSQKTPPLICFYLQSNTQLSGIAFDHIYLELETDTSNYYYVDLQPKMGAIDASGLSKWIHFSYPIGPYYQSNLKDEELFVWSITGSPSWSNINAIKLYFQAPSGIYQYLYVDDLHFEANMCRVAKNSTSITANKLKTRIITDNIGKDDSLKATDDSGTLAKLAYAELLRLQKTSLIGSFVTPMIKDLLPGQWLHVHSKKTASGTYNIDGDMRASLFTHIIDRTGFKTTYTVTDDLTNAHTRPKYEDLNKILSAVRPEFQDRQATSIKTNNVDIDIPRFEKDYPS
jgi:hypothetical protein